MADVSVEFGAKDVGLEKTLETIQKQMTSLQSEVNSGTLSFQEISQKMREIKSAEGIFAKLGGEVSGAAKSFKELEEQTRRAEAITKANRSAIEIYSDTVDELQKLLDAGAISQKTYAVAIEKAETALKAATPETEEAKRANQELEASLKKAEQETKALAEEQKRAEAITKANRSATEIYNQEVEELHKFLSAGKISMETFEKAVAKADAKLTAANPQVEELGKEIENAGNKSTGAANFFDASFAKIAGATAVGQLAVKAFTGIVDGAFAAARATVQGFTEALQLGGTLSDLSAQTGEAAGNLLLLQRAFDNTGIGADAVGTTLARLSDKIVAASEGSKEAANAFGRMGLSASELQGKLPNEQLAIVASGISGIQDPAIRAATAIDIFGRSGAQLLPLLTNFSAEMTEAGATVGSMADIMNRRSTVFDAVGDRFLVISEKVRDFAAGILDRALPAIDAITSALSRIDAAAVGQRLADAFLGGQEAMRGFQAAVDAISIGQVGLAFKAFWESLKLQSMQTANEIYKNLVAGFQAAGQFLGKIFDPSGALLGSLFSAFEMFGQRFASIIQRNLANAFAGSKLTEGLALQLNIAANESTIAANKIEDSLKGAGGRIADQFVQAGAAFPNSFAENYAKVPPLIDGIAEQQSKVAAIEAEVAAATAATTAEREKQAAQTKAEMASRQALKDQAAADAAAEKAAKAELIQLEIDRNNAIAAGNTDLAARLASELESKKAQQEIADLAVKYQKDLGLSVEEAGKMAANFVNAKNAAGGAAENTEQFASWIDYIEGTQPEEPVKKLSEKSADARKEIEAFGQYIGKDLKGMSYPDIAKELKVDILGKTGSQQIDAILDAVKDKLPDGKLTQPIDEKQSKKVIGGLGKTLETDLKKSIDLALKSSEGTKVLNEIKSIADAIKTAVQKIEPKLPQQALA